MRLMRHAFAAATLLLGACAFTEPYPAAWVSPAPPASDDCRHLEGHYGDLGERPGSQAQPSLAYLLLERGAAYATRVSLSLPRKDLMEVVLWKDSTLWLTRTLSAGQDQFACDRGMLVLRRGRWVNEGQGHGRETFTIELSAAGDWLIARERESVVGLAVVFPVVASQTRWYRFPRLRDK
jgi:hypothetical protein